MLLKALLVISDIRYDSWSGCFIGQGKVRPFRQAVVVWLSGTTLVLIIVVGLHQAWLVLGWVTVCNYNILVFNPATQANSAWPSLGG